jgi:hypothetical protein
VTPILGTHSLAYLARRQVNKLPPGGGMARLAVVVGARKAKVCARRRALPPAHLCVLRTEPLSDWSSRRSDRSEVTSSIRRNPRRSTAEGHGARFPSCQDCRTSAGTHAMRFGARHLPRLPCAARQGRSHLCRVEAAAGNRGKAVTRFRGCDGQVASGKTQSNFRMDAPVQDTNTNSSRPYFRCRTICR